MKKHTVLILAAIMLAACSFGVVRGSGRLVSDSRSVSDFDRVTLTTSGEVIISQGEEESLTVETDDNVMRHVTTQVEDGMLTLGTERGKLISATRLTFNLTVRDLAGLRLTGSGDVTVERLDANRLEINVTGSGDVRIGLLAAKDVEVEITGSGDVDLAGQATGQDISVSGSGNYRGGDLRSDTVEITIRGSGGATVWATGSLDGSITGSGSVSYYGNPKTKTSASGSGKFSGLGEK